MLDYLIRAAIRECAKLYRFPAAQFACAADLLSRTKRNKSKEES